MTKSLYFQLAEYYDLLYAKKNYEGEVEFLCTIIDKYKQTKGRQLLEVACSTGAYLRILKKKFKCTALDISKDILGVALKNVSGVSFVRGDMTRFNLGNSFDVVMCLFGSIGYVKTKKNLKKSIHCLGTHVKKGGVLIIEPWYTKEEFIKWNPEMIFEEDGSKQIGRVVEKSIRGNVSIVKMHFLIRDKHTEYINDRHELGLFDHDTYIRLMQAEGFTVKKIKSKIVRAGCVFVGVKK